MIVGRVGPYGRWWSVDGDDAAAIAELFLNWALETPAR